MQDNTWHKTDTWQGSRVHQPQIGHMGIEIILSYKHLKNSKCRENTVISLFIPIIMKDSCTNRKKYILSIRDKELKSVHTNPVKLILLSQLLFHMNCPIPNPISLSQFYNLAAFYSLFILVHMLLWAFILLVEGSHVHVGITK